MPILFDLAKYLGSVFVETGTGTGDGVIAAMRARFKHIHSIEISEDAHELAQLAVKAESEVSPPYGTVTLHKGFSADLLQSICEPLLWQLSAKKSDHTTFFTFWLDAQARLDTGTSAEIGTNPWPLLDELKIIRSLFKGALKPPVILINRLGLMNHPDAWGGHNVTLENVAQLIGKIHSSYGYHLYPGEAGENDVLAAVPAWIQAASTWP